MPGDIEQISRLLAAIEDADQVVTLRAAVMRALSLSDIHGAYFLAPLTADPRIGRLLSAIGLSRTWERHYRSRLHLYDPLPGLSLNRSGAFYWPEATDKASLTDHQQRYLRIAARYGLGSGIGVACYGPHGRSGFLGVAWEASEPPPPSVLQQVQIIGQSSFQRYCQLVRSDKEIPPLSNRELEVLSWMSEGKSNAVIGQILGISRSSVDIYVRRIFSKLEVGDRTAACLKAFSLGLTVTGDYHRLVEEARQREPGSSL